jgi:hypothetical protein
MRGFSAFAEVRLIAKASPDNAIKDCIDRRREMRLFMSELGGMKKQLPLNQVNSKVSYAYSAA